MTMPGDSDTHEFTNQSPPYEDVDLFGSDQPLQDAVSSSAAAVEGLAAFGRRWGAADMFACGRQANADPPKLEIVDAKGARRDIVEFHPAYHALMAESVAAVKASLADMEVGDEGIPADVHLARLRTKYNIAQ